MNIKYLADSYNTLVNDSVREQIFFDKHQHYRYTNYQDIKSSIYMNQHYMQYYMHGLAISMFLWPQHRKYMQYFIDTIPKYKRGKYLEIGPGHGLYIKNAIKYCSFDFYEAIDISPTSINLVKLMLKSIIRKNTHYHVHQKYFLTMDNSKKYDAIIMSEVLEHVENPTLYLKKTSKLADTDTYIFITTCINAAMLDHIYLFNSIKHLEDIVSKSGLKIKNKLIIPYKNKTLEESEKLKLPINIAMLLEIL